MSKILQCFWIIFFFGGDGNLVNIEAYTGRAFDSGVLHLSGYGGVLFYSSNDANFREAFGDGALVFGGWIGYGMDSRGILGGELSFTRDSISASPELFYIKFEAKTWTVMLSYRYMLGQPSETGTSYIIGGVGLCHLTGGTQFLGIPIEFSNDDGALQGGIGVILGNFMTAELLYFWAGRNGNTGLRINAGILITYLTQ